MVLNQKTYGDYPGPHTCQTQHSDAKREDEDIGQKPLPSIRWPLTNIGMSKHWVIRTPAGFICFSIVESSRVWDFQDTHSNDLPSVLEIIKVVLSVGDYIKEQSFTKGSLPDLYPKLKKQIHVQSLGRLLHACGEKGQEAEVLPRLLLLERVTFTRFIYLLDRYQMFRQPPFSRNTNSRTCSKKKFFLRT